MTFPSGTPQPNSTEVELFRLLGKIDTRLTVIEGAVSRLDKAINGNGKNGLIDDFRLFIERFRDLELYVQAVDKKITDHIALSDADAKNAKDLLAVETKDAKDLLAEDAKSSRDVLAQEVKTAKDKKDKISARTWTLIIGVILAIITQAVALGMLYLRAGIIK